MVYQGKKINLDLDGGGEEASRRPTSAPRITTPLEVDFGRKGIRRKVAGALSREADHDDHGAPATPASTESETEGGVKGFLSKAKDTAEGLGKWGLEKANEIRSALRELRQVRRAYAKGELTKEMLDEVSDTILDVLGMEITRGLAPYTLVPLVAWRLGARDHALEKDTPDYSDLSTQILNMHEDEDHPGLYHHATESLCAGMDETHLRKHYSCLTGQNKFRQSYSSPNGRKLLKEQLGKLLGTEVDEIHELTEKIKALAGRLGIHITPPNPGGTPPTTVSTFVPHDLQHRHANHSLHFLSNILQLAYNEITADRLAKIMGPNEDVKLDKDINKLGNTLMEHVKGSTDLAEQFLGNLDMNVFDKAFRLLLDRGQLDEAVSDEPEEVKKQLYELFNLSGHVNANELNAFMNGLIGLPPYSGAIPANHKGGSLGVRNALSADAQIKFDELREKMDRARCNLLGITPPSLVSNPAEATNSPRSQLFPPKAETIKYEEFGAQLGKAVRNKNGVALQRARSNFLRGWDAGEFENHFLQLADATSFSSAVAGSKTERDALKKLITELTGLNVTRVNLGLWQTRMRELRTRIGVNGGGPPPAPYTYDPVDAGLGTTKQASLANILGRIEQIVGPELDNLYVEESLERNLGSTLTNADDAKLAGLFNKLNNGFFVLNYGALGLTPTSFNLTTTNMATRKAFKDQLSAFIGANAHFIWTETNVRALLDALDDKADDVDRLSRGGVHANSANLRSRVTHLRAFIGKPAPAPVAPAPASANLIEYLGTI